MALAAARAAAAQRRRRGAARPRHLLSFLRGTRVSAPKQLVFHTVYHCVQTVEIGGVHGVAEVVRVAVAPLDGQAMAVRLAVALAAAVRLRLDAVSGIANLEVQEAAWHEDGLVHVLDSFHELVHGAEYALVGKLGLVTTSQSAQAISANKTNTLVSQGHSPAIRDG